ncbi:MAG: DUF63 family protein [Thermoplasmatota archaeon]
MPNLPLWTVPAIFLGVFALAAGASLASHSFYENVVWQDYWGPIKADANGHGPTDLIYDCPDPTTPCRETVGAHSGYNLVNTGSWAILLGLCILFVSQILQRIKVPMDSRLIIGATAWVVAGSIFHVMEDTHLLAAPLQYVFITPPIYLLFATFGVLSLLIGHYLKLVQERAGTARAMQKLWLLLCVPVLGYLALWLDHWPVITAYIHPVWVALFVFVAFLLARWRTLHLGRIDRAGFVLDMSVIWILLGIAYVVLFLKSPWFYHSAGMPSAALWAPGLAGAAALAVYLVGRWLFADARRARAARFLGQPRNVSVIAAVVLILALVPFLMTGAARTGLGAWTWPGLRSLVLALAVAWGLHATGRGLSSPRGGAFARALLQPINLLIVFSQMLDGFATALGIDLNNYEEKHVLSELVIHNVQTWSQRFGWRLGETYPTFVGFVPIKLAVSLIFIGIIDAGKNRMVPTNPSDAARQETMVGLVKFAIIMVGLGPGIRDFLRLSLGV